MPFVGYSGLSGAGGNSAGPVIYSATDANGSAAGVGWGVITAGSVLQVSLSVPARVVVTLTGCAYTDVSVTSIYASFGVAAGIGDPGLNRVDAGSAPGGTTGEHLFAFAVTATFDLDAGTHDLWAVVNANGGAVNIPLVQMSAIVGEAP